MKICIDISQSVYPRGVGRYTRELVSHLLKINPSASPSTSSSSSNLSDLGIEDLSLGVEDLSSGPKGSEQVKNQYVLFGSSLRQQKTLKDFFNSISDISTSSDISSQKLRIKPQAISKFYPIPPTILEFLFNRFHLSIDAFVGKVDIFHSSDWTQPKSSAKKVTTIHDMIVYKFPQLFDSKTISVQKRRLAWVKKEVDKIIAVSDSTKKDIIEILQIPEEKIEVIYEAAAPIFYKRGEDEIEIAKKKFGIKKDYILTVNTRSSQKLAKLLEAFSVVRKDLDITLVVVGEKIQSYQDIINIGFVLDEDLARLYSGVSVFVFPSFYEGFGLPVLEAMACGAPVVCSNTSSLPEIAGKAAVYVNPNSKESIVEGVKKVLMDKKFAQELSKQSVNQASQFSWEKTARETLRVYEEV